MQPYLDLIAKHQWIGLAALIIGLVVRLLKEDTSFPPFAIPARWRPMLALGLGVVSGALQAASTGTPWRDAVLGGLVSAFLAIAGHETVVNSLRDGEDVPMPAGLTKKTRLRPASIEPPTPPDPSVRQR
jgi:hypothetical protein